MDTGIESILVQAEIIDKVLLGQLRNGIKKIQIERDMFRGENARLACENERLKAENGKNTIFCSIL